MSGEKVSPVSRFELVTRRYVPGGTLAVGVGFAQTEALGVFRIDDVLTGDYYVRAYVSGRTPPDRPTGCPSGAMRNTASRFIRKFQVSTPRRRCTSRRVEIRASNGALTRKYYVDGSEQSSTGEAGRWLADNLPFFVRRSGVGARERVQQLLAARRLDAVLREIGLFYTDSVRGRYFRALFDSGLLDVAAMNAPLLLAARSMSSSHELSETARSALGAGFQEGDGLFRVVDPISSSVEKRRVLMALLDRPRLTSAVQLAALAAAAKIESNTECATVLDAFAARYPVTDPAMRDAFLAALKTVDSGSARARLLARLENR